MIKKSFQFSTAKVQYYFGAEFSYLKKMLNPEQTVFIADENFALANKSRFAGWKTIVIPSGEQQKVMLMIDKLITRLISVGAGKQTTLVGIGGGVVTDITGYLASVFMRGIDFGFVPTSVLAMTDAAIGGKNGVNVGLYKNMAGLIRQPQFIIYDYTLLKTLPKEEWVNGFAEIIKHACIYDAAMFKLLEGQKLPFFQKNMEGLAKLIERNVLLKTKAVLKDELETGDRKLLNFGHTIGHAIENLYRIPHGQAVGIGMGVACKISEQLTGFTETGRVLKLLKQYGHTPHLQFDNEKAWKLVLADKKSSGKDIDYIVLDKIGKASIAHLPLEQLHNMINEL